jgi:hypothetical protein
MGETVLLTGWLNSFKRKKLISIHQTLQAKYEVTMNTLFYDIEDAAKKHREHLVQHYGSMFYGENADMGDVYDQIQEEAYEFYQAEKLMEYNFHLSLLATMYQIFEQQLRAFIYEELNHRLSPVRTEEDFPEFGTNMGKIKEAFKHVNYDLETTIQWDRIATLADLINTYKHGDGRSSKRLYKKNPELFIKAYYGERRLMDQELTTNAEIVFDLKEIEFRTFSDAIIDFWKGFPEHLSGSYTFPD